MNNGFSKILILVIAAVIAAGGVLVWQYWPGPAEEGTEPSGEEQEPADETAEIFFCNEIQSNLGDLEVCDGQMVRLIGVLSADVSQYPIQDENREQQYLDTAMNGQVVLEVEELILCSQLTEVRGTLDVVEIECETSEEMAKCPYKGFFIKVDDWECRAGDEI